MTGEAKGRLKELWTLRVRRRKIQSEDEKEVGKGRTEGSMLSSWRSEAYGMGKLEPMKSFRALHSVYGAHAGSQEEVRGP